VALLVYCLALTDDHSVMVAAGVCGTPVRDFELGRLRVYVSDIADVEGCLGTAEAMKKAAVEFKQVQREIVAVITPLAFGFPTLLEKEDALPMFVGERESEYEAVLRRLAGTVQYEVLATWDEQQGDTATPVSGAEYRKRREQEMARVAAVDEKLKRVTAGIVREWRQRRERKAHRWFGLLERERREEFLTALRSAGPSEGVRVRLSGPWPPSEFVEESQETD
jgi:hypothetical protein